eukprot:2977147-Rhodomonas_salina.1
MIVFAEARICAREERVCSRSSRGARDPASREVVAGKVPPPTASATSPSTLLTPIWRWHAGDGQAADGQDSAAEPACC